MHKRCLLFLTGIALMLPINTSFGEEHNLDTSSQSRYHQQCGFCRKGHPGDMGYPGIPGIDGMPGPNGRPGRKGQPGVLYTHTYSSRSVYAVSGQRGEDGYPGYPGLRGSVGMDGSPGLKGLEGVKGADGLNGEPGSPGHDASCDCQHLSNPTKPKVVAFQGLAVNVNPSGNASDVIKFDKIVTNEGGLLSENATDEAVFQVSVSGLYAFYSTSVANEDAPIDVVMSHNDNVIMRSALVSANGTKAISSGHALLQLTLGDSLKLEVETLEDSGNEYQTSDLTFTAYLIK